MNYDHDIDEEILKLQVSMRKQIPYEDLNMGQNQQRLDKLNINNEQRMKLVKDLLQNHSELIHKLKLHSRIVNNWITYVGFLNKEEFLAAFKTIGVKIDDKLFNSIFWLYDLNGDGKIDDKEFWIVNSLFRGRSLADKINSKLCF